MIIFICMLFAYVLGLISYIVFMHEPQTSEAVYLECKKLFITTHYNTKSNYDLVDLSEYIDKSIIRIERGLVRSAESGETHGRTYFYGPAVVRKKKGNDLWDWAEL